MVINKRIIEAGKGQSGFPAVGNIPEETGRTAEADGKLVLEALRQLQVSFRQKEHQAGPGRVRNKTAAGIEPEKQMFLAVGKNLLVKTGVYLP